MTNVEIIKCNISGRLSVKTISRTVLETCLKCIGRKLLVLLHWIYSLVIFFKRMWDNIRHDFMYRGVIKNSKSVHFEFIRQRVVTYSKIPSHMVFILGSDSVSYGDIVKIVEWCFPAGIPYISFYDHNNGIDPNIIFETFCKYSTQSIPNIKWGKSFSREIKEESRKRINGFTWKPKITVHVYKREDGLEGLVELVKELHQEGTSSIDQSNLNTLLLKKISAPDPDLAVICGSDLSSFALLPWHMRITQFQSLNTHHNISVVKFLLLLEQFSQCEQRYGK